MVSRTEGLWGLRQEIGEDSVPENFLRGLYSSWLHGLKPLKPPLDFRGYRPFSKTGKPMVRGKQMLPVHCPQQCIVLTKDSWTLGSRSNNKVTWIFQLVILLFLQLQICLSWCLSSPFRGSLSLRGGYSWFDKLYASGPWGECTDNFLFSRSLQFSVVILFRGTSWVFPEKRLFLFIKKQLEPEAWGQVS